LSASKALFDKAKKFNEIYFKLYDINQVFNSEFDAAAVNKNIPKIDGLLIPEEFVALNESKKLMKTLNDGYCNTQLYLCTELKKYDKIIYDTKRTDEIKKLEKNEKYKNYKYLVEIIGKYADNRSFKLPQTKCN
jgi:glutathionylspermidine synthase